MHAAVLALALALTGAPTAGHTNTTHTATTRPLHCTVSLHRYPNGWVRVTKTCSFTPVGVGSVPAPVPNRWA